MNPSGTSVNLKFEIKRYQVTLKINEALFNHDNGDMNLSLRFVNAH